MVKTHGVSAPDSTSAAASSEDRARSKRRHASSGVGPAMTSEASRHIGPMVGCPATMSSTAFRASSGAIEAMAEDAAAAIWLAPDRVSDAARYTVAQASRTTAIVGGRRGSKAS